MTNHPNYGGTGEDPLDDERVKLFRQRYGDGDEAAPVVDKSRQAGNAAQ